MATRCGNGYSSKVYDCYECIETSDTSFENVECKVFIYLYQEISNETNFNANTKFPFNVLN